MLQNAYFHAKIGANTAENEQHFAEILPKTGNYPTGPQGQRARAGERYEQQRARRARGRRRPSRYLGSKEGIRSKSKS